jgi:UDPglucose--hexose-1-phosphate uridylyltransferase
MSELRQNLATREWVIIAPERLKGRPLISEPNALMETMPDYADKCPFCPRNADRYENIEVSSVPHPDPDNKSQSPWLARCVENKYKFFDDYETCPTGDEEFQHDGIYYKSLGCGSHELVIESPEHNKTIATMDQEEVEAIVRLYLERFNAIKKNPNNKLTIIFKNHGARSGASQVHPHSQILGMRVVPNYLRFLIDEATRFFDTTGVCVFCKILEYELESGDRVIYENDRFVSYVPYAASAPYEIRILPKVHDSLFGDMPEEEIVNFSDCLRVSMARLYRVLSNPDFNLLLRNPPYALSGVPFYHWHMQIVPHTNTPGGFELGSRINVNVVSPEQAAKDLRDATL